MLNDRLKELRKQKGLTQDEAAAEIHVVRQTLSKWEKGTSVPDANSLALLAGLYEVSVSDLLGISTDAASPDSSYIVRELTELNARIDERCRRHRLLWRIVMIIGIAVILWGAAGTIFGFILYHSIISSMDVYGSETANQVLSGAISAVVTGVSRAAAGIIITIISVFMAKSFR